MYNTMIKKPKPPSNSLITPVKKYRGKNNVKKTLLQLFLLFYQVLSQLDYWNTNNQ